MWPKLDLSRVHGQRHRRCFMATISKHASYCSSREPKVATCLNQPLIVEPACPARTARDTRRAARQSVALSVLPCCRPCHTRTRQVTNRTPTAKSSARAMPEAPPRPGSRLKAAPRTGRSERDRQGGRQGPRVYGFGVRRVLNNNGEAELMTVATVSGIQATHKYARAHRPQFGRFGRGHPSAYEYGWHTDHRVWARCRMATSRPGYRSYRRVITTSGFWLPVRSAVMTMAVGFRYPAAAGMWIQPLWSWPATSAVTSQRKAGWPVPAGPWRTADS